jgi:GAF domain-containing protein
VIEAAPASVRAEALLTATNEFLRSDDLRALATALVTASVSMFAPTKVAVMLGQPGGGHKVMATFGGAPGAGGTEAAPRRGELAAALIQQALEGTELCTDDPGSEAFASQVRAYGAESGLAVPIHVATGPIGVLIVLHAGPTSFEPSLREAARSASDSRP